jgi:hypothetical protein
MEGKTIDQSVIGKGFVPRHWDRSSFLNDAMDNPHWLGTF